MSYNKMRFDKSHFNKQSGSDTFSIEIISTSNLDANLRVISPLSDYKLEGHGGLDLQLVMQQDIGNHIRSRSELKNASLVLSNEIKADLSGEGSFEISTNVKTPFGITMGGSGTVGMDKRMFLYQTMKTDIRSSGSIDMNPRIVTPFEPGLLYGSGSIDAGVALQLPIRQTLSGKGDLELRRLGAFNENTIELIGTEIAPGQTVTIDTDLLQVLIGAVEDVSSVTTDSVFFELNPGENEITIRTDTGQTLEVVAIWQNRWL